MLNFVFFLLPLFDTIGPSLEPPAATQFRTEASDALAKHIAHPSYDRTAHVRDIRQ